MFKKMAAIVTASGLILGNVLSVPAENLANTFVSEESIQELPEAEVSDEAVYVASGASESIDIASAEKTSLPAEEIPLSAEELPVATEPASDDTDLSIEPAKAYSVAEIDFSDDFAFFEEEETADEIFQRDTNAAYATSGELKLSNGDDGYATWTLSEDGTLTISGIGRLDNWSDWPWNASAVKKAVIQSGITNVGRHMFEKCENLESVSISNSVTNIESSAFDNCTSLTSITIPNSVTNIGSWAFSNCTGLTSITIPDSVTELGFCAFWNCTSLTSITIPDSVTELENRVFYDCTSLTSITIPDRVTKLGSDLFYKCTSLKSINIPDSVTEIGDQAFEFCPNLTKLIFSGTSCDFIKKFGVDTDMPGKALSSLPYGHSIDQGTIETAGTGSTLGSVRYTCNNCGKSYVLTYYTENGEVALAGMDQKDWGADKALELVIPSQIGGNRVVSLNPSAFSWRKILVKVTIPDTVTKLGYNVFNNCSNLEEIVLPASVTEIGGSAFSYCSSLTAISLPNSITKIESSLFSNCSSLSSVKIPDGVTIIGSDAFSGCTGLTDISIPDSVTLIWSSSFKGCSSLTKVILPEGLQRVEGLAFADCTGLTEITVPSTVTWIGNNAFGMVYSNVSLSYKLLNGFHMSGYTYSAAQKYAEQYSIPFTKRNHNLTGESDKVTVRNIETKTFTGKPVTQTSVTLVYNGYTLKEGTDYKVSYKDNTNAGTATILFNFKGDLSGTISRTFDIRSESISKATITGIVNKAYTGKAITQTPVVKLNGVTLKKNVDYMLTYSNNKAVGTAGVTICGKGNLYGNIYKSFNITRAVTKKAQPMKVTVKSPSVKYAKVKKTNQTIKKASAFTITKNQGTVTFKKISGNSKITINSKTGNITVKKGLKKGTYSVKVRITAAGNTKYKSGSKTVTIKIKVK